MTKKHELWLWLKRFLHVGWFVPALIGDKCNSHWTDRECPNPPTCYEYHIGQFGHKVKFLYCDECYKHWKKMQSDPNTGFLYQYDRKFKRL